jgi:hypothetical protein
LILRREGTEPTCTNNGTYFFCLSKQIPTELLFFSGQEKQCTGFIHPEVHIPRHKWYQVEMEETIKGKTKTSNSMKHKDFPTLVVTNMGITVLKHNIALCVKTTHRDTQAWRYLGDSLRRSLRYIGDRDRDLLWQTSEFIGGCEGDLVLDLDQVLLSLSLEYLPNFSCGFDLWLSLELTLNHEWDLLR